MAFIFRARRLTRRPIAEPVPVTTAPPGQIEERTQLSPATAPNRLSPADVRRGLRLSTIEGAVATVFISITGAIGGSVFLTGFALLLGANSFQLGLLGALPFIGQIFQYVGAYLEERAGNRRKLVLFGSLASRLIWVLLLALPFLSGLGGAQLGLFLVGLACSYAAQGIGGNAWLSWMSDLVPARERGRYFGVRNAIAGVSAMATTFLASLALDALSDAGQETLGYALILGVAVLAGVVASALIAQQPEPPMAPKARVSLRDLLGGPLRDARFRNFVLAAAGWALVTGIAAPFFNAYGLNMLKLSFATLGLTAIITSAVSLVFTPLLGALQDKYGYRNVLVLCILGSVPLPWGWVLSTPDNLIPLWLTSIGAGMVWPGIAQGLVNVLMERAPEGHRGPAMAAHSAITGVGTLVAGLLGGILATVLAPVQFDVGAFTLDSLTMLFIASCLGRLLMAGVFWKTL